MKKSIAIAIMALITTVGFAQQSPLKKQKVAVSEEKTLKVETNQVELGDNMELKKQDFTVKASNVGAKPITIRRVATTAFLKQKNSGAIVLQPGQSINLEMVHEPNAAGQFLETMVIESDATNTMEIVKVFGTIADKQASKK